MAEEYPDRWRTNKRTGSKFPVKAGRPNPEDELARLQGQQKQYTDEELARMSTADLDRIIRQSEGDAGPVTAGGNAAQPQPGGMGLMEGIDENGRAQRGTAKPPYTQLYPNAPHPVMST